MKDKFLKAAAITPDIKVGDTDFNTENIIKSMNIAHKQGVKLAVFPELVISGYTCSELKNITTVVATHAATFFYRIFFLKVHSTV